MLLQISGYATPLADAWQCASFWLALQIWSGSAPIHPQTSVRWLKKIRQSRPTRQTPSTQLSTLSHLPAVLLTTAELREFGITLRSL
jgi:hypothetical protein